MGRPIEKILAKLRRTAGNACASGLLAMFSLCDCVAFPGSCGKDGVVHVSHGKFHWLYLVRALLLFLVYFSLFAQVFVLHFSRLRLTKQPIRSICKLLSQLLCFTRFPMFDLCADSGFVLGQFKPCRTVFVCNLLGAGCDVGMCCIVFGSVFCHLSMLL